MSGEDEEAKVNPPPMTDPWAEPAPGTLQPEPRQLEQTAAALPSEPADRALSAPPLDEPTYSPASTSYTYHYQSATSPTAAAPYQHAEQQQLTVTGDMDRSSSSTDSSLGLPMSPPPPRSDWRTVTGTVTISDTATSDSTFPSSGAPTTEFSIAPAVKAAQRSDGGRRSSSGSVSSFGGAASGGGSSGGLPAGANRFTQLTFDDKGNLVCQVLPISTAPMAFGIWAYNMALCTAALCVFFGPFSLIWWWYDTSPLYSGSLSLAAGLYAICLGPLIVAEERHGLPVGFLGSFFDTAVSRYTIRSVGYVVLSSLLYLSWPTVIPAISLCIVGIVNRMACAMGERFEYCGGRQPLQRRAGGGKKAGKKESFFRRVYLRLRPLLVIAKTIRDSNRVGIVIWLALYAAGNVVLFVMGMMNWIDKVKATKRAFDDKLITHDMVLSYWIAPAKAFGLLLDLNCSLILLPVCRTVIKWLYEQSTVDQHLSTRLLRFALRLVPLDFALQSHALIGSVILLAAVGHTLAHFVNFALAETVTLAVLSGPWPLISGGLLIGVMLLMYSSTSRRLRFAKFELFFETHHLFIVFFVLLLVHGAHGKGPNFWKYFIGPAALYVVERLLRIYRGRLPVKVLSAQFMQDVMCLEFAKEGVFARPYRTGQYLQLQCPTVSPLQWHPFTISSAPSDPTVTVHIKISTDKPSSFTYRVAAYMTSLRRLAPPVTVNVAVREDEDEQGRDSGRAAMAAMADRPPVVMARQRADAGYEYVCVTLDRPDSVTPSIRLPGRFTGPDGRPLFRIDGPHPAPAQHLSEYDVSLVVGAGIGSTPLSSCLRQVVQHDWATDRPEHMYQPSVAYFVLVLQHDQIQSFRWLVQLIRESQQKVNELRAAGRMKSKHFEVHIYVTSPPSKQQQNDDCAAILQDMALQQQTRGSASPSPSTPVRSPQLTATRTSAAASVGGSGWQLTLDDYLLAQLMTRPNMASSDPQADWSALPAIAAATAPPSPAAAPSGSLAISISPASPASAAPPSPASAVSHRLSDVRVYSGRPRFAQLFGALSARHSGRRVGVMFCGAPVIANDLRQQCKAQNERSDIKGARFQLHAENF